MIATYLSQTVFITGLTNQMVPEASVNSTDNLLVSVNKSGVSENGILFAAY